MMKKRPKIILLLFCLCWCWQHLYAGSNDIVWLKKGSFTKDAGLVHRVGHRADTTIIFDLKQTEDDRIDIRSTTITDKGTTEHYSLGLAHAGFRPMNLQVDADGNLYLLLDVLQTANLIAGLQEIAYSNRTRQLLLKLDYRCAVLWTKQLALALPELNGVVGKTLFLTAQEQVGGYYDDHVIASDGDPAPENGAGALILAAGLDNGNLVRTQTLSVATVAADKPSGNILSLSNELPLKVHGITGDAYNNWYALIEWRGVARVEGLGFDLGKAIKLNDLTITQNHEPGKTGVGRYSSYSLWLLVKLAGKTTLLQTFYTAPASVDPINRLHYDEHHDQLNVCLNDLMYYKDSRRVWDWNGYGKNKWATRQTPLSLVLAVKATGSIGGPFFIVGTSHLDINDDALDHLCNQLQSVGLKEGSYLYPADINKILLKGLVTLPAGNGNQQSQLYLGNQDMPGTATIYYFGKHIFFSGYGFIDPLYNTNSDIHKLKYNLSRVVRPEAALLEERKELGQQKEASYYLGIIKKP